MDWKKYMKERRGWIESAKVPVIMGRILHWMHTDITRHGKDIIRHAKWQRDAEKRILDLTERVRGLEFLADASSVVYVEHGVKPKPGGLHEVATVATTERQRRSPGGLGTVFDAEFLEQAKKVEHSDTRYTAKTTTNRGEWVTNAKQLLFEIRAIEREWHGSPRDVARRMRELRITDRAGRLLRALGEEIT